MKQLIEETINVLKENEWTQGSLARDKNDSPIFPGDLGACKFCLMGAVGRVSPDFETRSSIFKEIAKQLEKQGVEVNISEWNDQSGRTKEEVIELLEEVKNESSN